MNQQRQVEKMKAQRKMMQKQAQDAELLSLGWQNYGIAFFTITVSIVMYAAFF